MHTDPRFFDDRLSALALVELFDRLPDVIFYAKDRQSRYVAANTAMLEVKQMTRAEEILGKTDNDLHPPALADAYRAEDRQVIKSNTALVNQIWFVLDPSGRPGWFNSSKVPLCDRDGHVVGVAGVRYAVETPAACERMFKALTPVIRVLEERHRESLSMNELAAIAGMSVTHFNRQFAQLLGISPTRLLHAIRIDRARQLLARSDRTIADIAHDSGYCDQSHFTRHFRRHCGITPNAYRRRFREHG